MSELQKQSNARNEEGKGKTKGLYSSEHSPRHAAQAGHHCRVQACRLSSLYNSHADVAEGNEVFLVPRICNMWHFRSILIYAQKVLGYSDIRVINNYIIYRTAMHYPAPNRTPVPQK